MFIELAEFLRCPEHHEPDSLCVLAADETIGRDVVSGVVGCPVCRREYPVRDGIADFSAGVDTPVAAMRSAAVPVEPHVVQALLDLGGAGGYVVLQGAAAAVGAGLQELIGGVHFVALNASPSVAPTPALSLLRGPRRWPLKSSMARGVVVSADAGRDTLDEAVRVLLRGLRLVVLRERVAVRGVERLAVGKGMWVGQKMG